MMGNQASSSSLALMAQATVTSLEGYVQNVCRLEGIAETRYQHIIRLEKTLRAIDLKIEALDSRQHTADDRGDLLAEIKAMVTALLPANGGRHG